MIWRSLVAALIFIGTPSAAFAQIDPDLLADAERGDASAQSRLGNMYAIGEGVPENDIEAVKWYRLAAEQGYFAAQSNLGLMYVRGEGVPTNFIKAYAWWSMAAAHGDESASKNKDIVTEKMTSQQIAEAQAYAARCFEHDYKGCD
jgi:TPR repeat protein